MKISFSSVGPIKQGDVELKPLTVFIGPNNSGKTYTCYALCYLFDWSASVVSAKDFVSVLSGSDLEYVREIGTRMMKRNPPELEELITKGVPLAYRAKSILFSSAFSSYIKSDRRNIRNPKATVEFLRDEIIPFAGLPGRFSPISTLLIASMMLGSDLPEGAMFDRIERLFAGFFQPFTDETGESLYFFPSYRNTIMATLPTFLFNAFQASQAANGMSSLFPKPVVDFVGFLTRSPLPAKEEHDFRSMVSFVERKMMGGRLLVEKQKLQTFPEISFVFGGKKKVSMQLSASAIQQLAPLVLYLASAAKKGDTVIIDEPEIHLHPELQLRFAELAAAMVNAGIRVVFSTHTPYIVDHINNLIVARKVVSEKAKKRERVAKILNIPVEHLDLFLLDKEKTGAYLFKSGGIRDISTDGEIDWTEFGGVSDMVGEIRDKLENV